MRVAAAVVLAPLTVGIAYLGGWLWALLVLAAAVGLYVEWLTIVGAARNTAVLVAGVVALLVGGLCMVHWIAVAAAVMAAGLVVVAIAGGERRVWAATGLAYAACALVASDLVRGDAETGFLALMFVLLVVWVTDIGGYFAGRGIGGPKLWPRVSPKKTWAGAIGGLVGSLVVAAVFAVLGLGRMGPLLALASVLSVVSQLGDLFESAVKRTFGVKDSSHIIPGHGGLLDRLDGFVAAIVFAALVGALRGGIDGVGRGLMVW
ncbi:phosphatidate cytidylyltransferase [Bradyrhizobium sp. U87765 SZCCT0131]|nr:MULTISPECIES: phosphatidate cytidylyltransferase [unclassified Bradyrhizobium]MBR1220040.1 phosphatidate cytidylyltransferase [Bradyrhizobium sp. U87765 SZCCT0131]MBR1263504.1 phosphatidate cytidylyltransferase [Bradyrhizobium sp. U87765 SZCCT0134]MBR1309073.1 phosphatidate cytidylyltransferase [Bradyrhizobium sp. U87765 SZCCT0110]MBR1323836.1 phosphatidate cytidylyltransferase [Bradyrhizobium sp. U87765 SZCCT0109]MBR1349388.1 phosphatidate cytidylyltransferase [Bradyrhizobium sp. U87765 SZ